MSLTSYQKNEFVVKQQKKHTCSYCKNAGHNISSCKNTVFREMASSFHNTFLESSNNFPSYSMVHFKQILKKNKYGATYKQFLMNKHIVINESFHIIDNIVKYYFMFNHCDNEYKKEYDKQYQIYNNYRVRLYLDNLNKTKRFVIKPDLNIRIFNEEEKEAKEAEAEAEEEEDDECCVCLDKTIKKQDYVIFNCKHELCKECCKIIIQTVNTCKCPQCRATINNITVIDNDTVNELKDCLK